MKKSIFVIVALVLLAVLPVTAFAKPASPSMDRLVQSGWFCGDIAGAMHCFDPGDAHSKNTASVNVLVFDYEGNYLGTEILWGHYAGQPCAPDELIDLGGFMACHHFSF